MTGAVDLNPNYLTIVLHTLAKHVPECEVRAFGSRVTWTAKDYSDFDLAIVGQERVDWMTLSRLKEAFEDSRLPMHVDVLDWHAISDSFREVISRDFVVVQKSRETQQTDGDNQWRKVSLRDVIDLRLSSVDKKSKAIERSVQLCNYMDVYKNSFIHADMDFMTATATDREIAKCSLTKGDVVITKDSEKYDDIGVPALVRADVSNLVCAYHLAILRPRSLEVDGTFLYYALSADEAQNQFHSYANGITRFGLRKADIGLVEIPLPPLSEQRSIAHILGTLDDKIELNRRMNQTLEEMARALFKSWFVDFDPVRAKAALRRHALRHHSSASGEPPSNGAAPADTWTVERARAYLAGMNPAIAGLFPDRLVETEPGTIPEGWEAKPLSNFINVERGLSYKGSGLSTDGMPMHNLNSIYEGGGYKDEGIKYYKGDFQKRHVVEPGDVLVANTEQGHRRLLIGFAAVVPGRFGYQGLFSHHLYRIRTKLQSRLPSDFLCHMLNTNFVHGTVSGYATGTTVNMLPLDALRIPRIIVPPSELVTEFSTVAETARTRQERLIVECQSLTAQRDVLLPKLVSGIVQARNIYKRRSMATM